MLVENCAERAKRKKSWTREDNNNINNIRGMFCATDT
jgi:hypothetical protein